MSRFKFSLINDISISKKLLYLNLVGVLLPMFLLCIFFVSQIYNEYQKRENVLIDEGVNRVVKNLNVIVDSASDITYSYLSDRYMSNVFNEATYDTAYDALTGFHDIEDRIQADANTYEFIDDITIYHENKEIKFFGHVQLIDEESMDPWKIAFLEEPLNQAFRIEYLDNDVEVYFARKLNAFFSKSKDFVEVKLNRQVLEKQLSDEFLMNHKALIYLVDEKDNVIITNDENFSYSMNENSVYISDLISDNQRPLIRRNFKTNSEFIENWDVLVFYENNVLINIYDEISYFIMITLLILVFSSLLIWYISASISSRLKILDIAMTPTEDGKLKIVEGNLGKDEIGHTAIRYNEMVNNTSKLIKEIDDGRNRANELLSEKTRAYEELETLNEEVRMQGSKIHDLIYIDTLTNLKNRFAISLKIEELLKETSNPYRLAIMFLDIDNFKYINDTFGHEVGDKVIKGTANLLSKIESDSVSVGRFGGDEFIIVLRSNNLDEDLEELLKALLKLSDQAINIDSNKFYLSSSIGVTRYPQDGNSKDELIMKADLALNIAKEKGKNCFVVFNEAINTSFEKKINLQSRIKVAAVNKEFYLNYQPYIASDSGEVKGFEALIRWDCQGSEWVSPYELIRNAEEMGIIIELGEWIIEESARFIKKVNKDRLKPVSISINISIVQLVHKEFYQRLIEIINKVGVNPKDIYLEITETVLLNSIDQGVELIDRLKEVGFGISLDDFGTGYSSLNYFKKLPVTILKIDKTFIDNIIEDYYNKELIKSIVKISHQRQVLVTAEGVEEKEQVDYLKSAGVDLIQGYYYSKALSEEDAIKFLIASDTKEL